MRSVMEIILVLMMGVGLAMIVYDLVRIKAEGTIKFSEKTRRLHR